MNRPAAETMNDELIHAFVDGELPESEMQRVANLISESNELQAKKESIIALKQSLSDIFADDISLLEDKSPDAFLSNQSVKTQSTNNVVGSIGVADTGSYKKNRAPLYAAAACLLLGLLSGILGYRYIVDGQFNKPDDLVAGSTYQLRPVKSWLLQMANYQEMYSLDTLSHVKKAADEVLAADLERWQHALDADMVIPNLDAEGVEFRRGQILQSNAIPVIQLAYLAPGEEQPVAVCITPIRKGSSDDAAAVSNQTGEFGELNFIHWQHDQLEIAVMAKLPHTKLKELKRLVEKSFDSASKV